MTLNEINSTEQAISYGISIKKDKKAIYSLIAKKLRTKLILDRLGKFKNPTKSSLQRLFNVSFKMQFLNEAFSALTNQVDKKYI